MRCGCRVLPPPLEISTHRQNDNPHKPPLPQPPVPDASQLLHAAEAAFDLAVPHGMPRAGHSHTGRALCAMDTESLPPPLEITTNRQNRSPHKPPAQPCRCPQFRPHHTCCTLQRLHLTLQCRMACLGLATHTLAGLCALWLPSAASSSGTLQKPAKPQPPQTTCPALPQPPVQAPPPLLHAAEAAFDLVVPHGMPRRVGHPHTGRALCTVLAECCFLLWKSPQTGKTASPINHLHSTPAAAPSAGPNTPAAHSRGCI